MRSYHASILMPGMPACKAEFCCTVQASSLPAALGRIGRRIKKYIGRRRVQSVRIMVRVGEPVEPEPVIPRPELDDLAAAYLPDDSDKQEGKA